MKEMLAKWKNVIVETAKQNLLADNHILPVVFFLTHKMEVPEDMKSFLRDGETMLPIQDDGSSPMDLIVLVLPVDYEDPKVLSNMILLSAPTPEAAEMMKTMLAIGHAAGVEDPCKSVVKVFKQMNNVNEKDIVAMAMARMAKKLDPLAIVKIDEVWMASAAKDSKEPLPRDLKENPNATEALNITMETKDMMSMTIVPFEREAPNNERRDSGKVKTIGESIEMVDDGTGNRLVGRFCNFIRQPRT